mmetsp:Transcript_5854/g.10380  ORF Transcript_5854/g.10380 Transcript_5854/m.10380 type:complete len:83 (-) Transcript_5854:45-293(-)
MVTILQEQDTNAPWMVENSIYWEVKDVMAFREYADGVVEVLIRWMDSSDEWIRLELMPDGLVDDIVGRFEKRSFVQRAFTAQ